MIEAGSECITDKAADAELFTEDPLRTSPADPLVSISLSTAAKTETGAEWSSVSMADSDLTKDHLLNIPPCCENFTCPSHFLLLLRLLMLS